MTANSSASAANISSADCQSIRDECDELEALGPDWPDGQEHLEDFRALTARCRERLKVATTFNVSSNVTSSGNCTGGYSLHYVHIGKTGGSSVGEYLDRNDASYKQIHAKPVPRQDACLGSGKWLVTTRDPIDRLVSAFNWRNPRNGYGSEYGRNCKSPQEFAMYDCFKTVDEFAQGLDRDDQCGLIARRNLKWPSCSAHVGMGQAFYLRDSINCLRRRSVLVFRTESLQQDAHRAGQMLGFPNPSLPLPHEKSEYPLKNETYLSNEGRKKLRTALAEDYRINSILKRIAINM